MNAKTRINVPANPIGKRALARYKRTGLVSLNVLSELLVFGKSWLPQNRRIVRSEKRSKQRRKLNEKRDGKNRLLPYVSDDKKGVKPKRKLLPKSNLKLLAIIAYFVILKPLA
jgi:hypothetical protein